ncbi:MAG: hypothetical protein U9O24_04440 [Campylobacterota bacterium]|nr:hypothetical protein [Campylobacterota bacterium]
MENILPAYNDPLFSILLIIVIALIIALTTYAWGVYEQQKEEGNLLKFLDKFESAECALDTNDMPFEVHMIKPLGLLAKAFENSGEYHKSINIYLYLIKNISSDFGKVELMERLGNTYLHAGFLERARVIYVEILRNKPRSAQVLYELSVVYEMMHKFDKAKEVLEPLNILGEETATLSKFLDLSELKSNKYISTDEKLEKLQILLKEEPKLYRQIISIVLQLDTKSAWKMIDMTRLDELIDILWFLPNSQLDLDIITSNKYLCTLYYAKGYLQKPVAQSGLFYLDMLATVKQSGFEQGDLLFSYLCKKCKQNSPISFHRCPNCMAIGSIKVEESIVKSTSKQYTPYADDVNFQ